MTSKAIVPAYHSLNKDMFLNLKSASEQKQLSLSGDGGTCL